MVHQPMSLTNWRRPPMKSSKSNNKISVATKTFLWGIHFTTLQPRFIFERSWRQVTPGSGNADSQSRDACSGPGVSDDRVEGILRLSRGVPHVSRLSRDDHRLRESGQSWSRTTRVVPGRPRRVGHRRRLSGNHQGGQWILPKEGISGTAGPIKPIPTDDIRDAFCASLFLRSLEWPLGLT